MSIDIAESHRAIASNFFSTERRVGRVDTARRHPLGRRARNACPHKSPLIPPHIPRISLTKSLHFYILYTYSMYTGGGGGGGGGPFHSAGGVVARFGAVCSDKLIFCPFYVRLKSFFGHTNQFASFAVARASDAGCAVGQQWRGG